MSDTGYSMLGAGAWGSPTEMLWGGGWEGGSCLGTHVRIKDFKIKKKKQNCSKMQKKKNSFAESLLWTWLQMAGHCRGFFLSLRMSGNGEVVYWVHISLQNLSHRQLLMKWEREKERGEGSIGPRQGLKLCTGPASYRAPVIAVAVTPSGWFEFQINWGSVSPWEQHGENKMENKANIYSPWLLILSDGFIYYLRAAMGRGR